MENQAEVYDIKNAKMVVVIPNSVILRPILLIEPAFQFVFRKEHCKN